MLECQITGTGPRTLMLVHGSPGNAQAWQSVVKNLKGNYRLLLPTLPGHGKSEHAHPGAISGIAALLDELLTDEKTTPAGAPIGLVGYSFGGVVALDLALSRARRGDQRIDRLMLLEPVAMMALAGAGNEAHHHEAKQHFDSYLAAVAAKTPDAVAGMVDYWFGPGAFEAMSERMRQTLNAMAPVNALDVAATFGERYDAKSFAALTAKLRILIGGRSPPTAGRIAEAIKKMAPHTEIDHLPGATHAMLTTHGAELAKKIDEFCA